MDRNRKEVQDQQETKGAVNQRCSGIICPNCGGPTKVRNGRPNPTGNRHDRYRKCLKCATTFYTTESVSRIISIPDKNA